MDKNLLRDITYGMYVVTTKEKERNIGCIANSFCQITSTDNIVSISLNKDNYTNKIIKENKRYCLSIISEQTNPEVIGKFGFASSKDTDKFAGFDYVEKQGLPVIKEDCSGYLICEVFDIVDCGSHDIFLAKAVDGERLNNNVPMTYSYYHKVIKGKTPPKAPHYVAEEIKNTSSKKYECSFCGYIYDEGVEGIAFADLPEDFKCPICKMKKSVFKEIK